MFVLFEKDSGRLPAKVWLGHHSQIEPGCQTQLDNLVRLPFAFHHIAMMPDCHQGYGMPVGGVLATKRVVVPNAVGVDIGCGMRFLLTNIKWNDVKDAKSKDGQDIRKVILSTIMRIVPVGYNHQREPQQWVGFDNPPTNPDTGTLWIVRQEIDSARRQLGTLGGGNHFIELQVDQEGRLALMIHSGSRNFGKKICDVYNKQAQEINERYHSAVPREWDLAFLPYDDGMGQEYMKAMNYALDFAHENRRLMMERSKNVLYNVLEKYAGTTGIQEVLSLDCHHNYAALENHYGQNVIVHRKGAVRARCEDRVIIPGSMGTASYVGLGLGKSDSFQSCSHGSGRRLGRNEAKRKHTAQQIIEHMKAIDVIVLKPEKDDIAEECPQAYKDIEDVIKQENDLISVTHKLTPLGVIKG